MERKGVVYGVERVEIFREDGEKGKDEGEKGIVAEDVIGTYVSFLFSFSFLLFGIYGFAQEKQL